MGRELNDPVMIQSSIALLQKRFLQLQRAKELREVRELSRTFLQPLPFNPTTFIHPNDYCNFFINPEFVLFQPRSPAANISLSLWWNSQSKVDGQRATESPVFTSFRPAKTGPNRQGFSGGVEKCDTAEEVDTSLHL